MINRLRERKEWSISFGFDDANSLLTINNDPGPRISTVEMDRVKLENGNPNYSINNRNLATKP